MAEALKEQAKLDLLVSDGKKLSLGCHHLSHHPRQGLHRVLGGTSLDRSVAEPRGGGAHPIFWKSAGLVPRDRG